MAGLPTNRKFRCEVIDFALNYNTIDTTNMVEKYLFLTASNEMQILDGVQHPQKFNKLCNISVSTGAMTSLLVMYLQLEISINTQLIFKLDCQTTHYYQQIELIKQTQHIGHYH